MTHNGSTKLTIIITITPIPIANPKNPLGVISIFAITTVKLKVYVRSENGEISTELSNVSDIAKFIIGIIMNIARPRKKILFALSSSPLCLTMK